MGWTAIFDIINKVLPSREERIRVRINDIKREQDKLLKGGANTRTIRKYEHLANELRKLEEKLQSR